MKRFMVFFCCLLLITACSPREPHLKIDPPADPESGVAQHIRALTAEEMEGRRAGTRGEAKAAMYLARFLQKAGFKPAGDSETYFQAFSLAAYEPVMIDGRMTFRFASNNGKIQGENVLGLLPGKREDIIVISAHYDHLGQIKGQVYPGANDNASGVALVMELVEGLQGKTPPLTMLFAFWSAEEMGLLGSAHFCQEPTVPLDRIKLVINLDSLGNLTKDQILLGWLGPENKFSSEFIDSLSNSGWKINWEKTEKHSSDHASFAKKGIAGFTLLSPDWLEKNHTPDDTMELLNTASLEKLRRDLAIALASL